MWLVVPGTNNTTLHELIFKAAITYEDAVVAPADDDGDDDGADDEHNQGDEVG